MQTLSKWVLMVISLLWVTFSHAQRVVPVPALTAYQQECSVCHFAYPPGLLPPNSWKNITDALPKHFAANEDLSLDKLSVSAGVGLSWISPMGPLRFSYATPIVKQTGDRIQRLQFQIGTSF
jgi:hypothetical protein